jgi:hypothetical protein
MNWQSKTTSEVNKEKIWSELVKKEQQDIHIFDHYRASISTHGIVPAPISERQKRFLDKTQVLFDSAVQVALPELRQASSSHGRYALPLRNMQHRASMSLSASTSPAVASPLLSGHVHDASSGRASSLLSMVVSSSPTTMSSSSPFYRPTSAAEIGSHLAPLVKHRVAPFRYAIPKTDLRAGVM